MTTRLKSFYAGSIRELNPLSTFSGSVSVEVTNMSGAEWHSDCENPVFVSYHWLDENWSMVVFDGVRTPLPSGGLSPHSSAIISARIEPPGKLGEYYLVLTLVREGIAWFEFDAAFKLSTRQIVIKDIIPLTTSDFPSANKQIESIQDAASSWYFFHIPKTAGTSLTKILEDMFPIKEICPAHLWSALLLFSQEELKKFRLFRGHFYSYIDIIVPQRLNCFLFLRDPVERSLSHYAHICRDEGHYLHKKAVALGSLEGFLKDTHAREVIHNFQARCLIQRFDPIEIQRQLFEFEPNVAGDNYALEEILETTPSTLSEVDLFNAAKQKLDQLSFVGITEKFQESCKRLSKVMAKPYRQNDGILNASEGRMAFKALATDESEILLDLISVDMKLYQYALNRFAAVVS